jgi:hypothetical protein
MLTAVKVGVVVVVEGLVLQVSGAEFHSPEVGRQLRVAHVRPAHRPLQEVAQVGVVDSHHSVCIKQTKRDFNKSLKLM